MDSCDYRFELPVPMTWDGPSGQADWHQPGQARELPGLETILTLHPSLPIIIARDSPRIVHFQSALSERSRFSLACTSSMSLKYVV
jgi:hypothetical protein